MPDVEDELDDKLEDDQAPAVSTWPASRFFPCPFFHV